MECKRGRENPMSLLCFFLGIVISQNVIIPVVCASEEGQFIGDEKTYYTPTPGAWDDSKCNGAHHGTGSPHPTNPPVNCGTPPSGSYGTPLPHNGGYSPPSGGSSGGYYHSPPSGSGSVTPPSTGGSGGNYNSPPSYTPPSTGSGGSVPLLPSPTTPTIPLDPGSPFFGTYGWWIAHPTAIYGLLGYIGTVGGIFGAICTPIFGHDLTLPQALANSRTDGFGSLFREGTASLLNSVANRRFPFTTEEVRNSFTTALFSESAAAAQADVFRLANEGRLKPRE